jgi:basic amino acid/polyamine antiporter, APA family
MAGPTVTPEAGDNDLKRALGPVHLIALGIGAIIGAGIFVLTGHAAASYAGSGVVISFAIAGLGCLFAGLCYAEYAAMIPVAGSAYTYTYATMGRFLAWIIGWNLVLEYLAAGVDGRRRLVRLFQPTSWRSIALAFADSGSIRGRALQARRLPSLRGNGAYFNLPAVLLVALVTFVLDRRRQYERQFQQC